MYVEASPLHDVALALVDGLGPRRRRDLLARFGSARAVLEAGARELEGVPGIGRTLAAAVAASDLGVAAEHVARVRALGGSVLLPGHRGFPELLRDIPDPPLVLYARGRVDLLTQPAVAVVGSRRHTVYGARVTEMIAGRAAAAGLVVVSGLAIGIDAIAHREALAANGGTVAVLGTGVDIVYPRENRTLFERIAEAGCLLSERAPGVRPKPGAFQARNRLISGLAAALVVVEAGPRSGTSITAGCAAEQGRTVLAVPGPITGSASWGTNRLLRDGAKPLLEWEDLIEEYPELPRRAVPPEKDQSPDITSAERAVWDALGGDMRHVDQVATAAGLPVAQVLSTLSGMELRGIVRGQPGMHFLRVR